MKPINGVVIGIVTQVRPGEVKLKFPWLHESEDEEKESNWARIATAMAGNDRGTFLMPEVDDEVLVAFEKGSFEHPYVIGFPWNGKDKPPADDTQKRTIKTKSGHVVTFNDNPGSEGITIESQGGQKVELKDTPTGSISIETSIGNKIEFNDMGGSITLTALKDITLIAPLSISLKSASIALIAPNTSIGGMATTTPGTYTITAPNIQLNGTNTTIMSPSPPVTILSGNKLIIS